MKRLARVGVARTQLKACGLFGVVLGVAACTLDHPLPMASLAVVPTGGAPALDGAGVPLGSGGALTGGVAAGGSPPVLVGSGAGSSQDLGGQGGASP